MRLSQKLKHIGKKLNLELASKNSNQWKFDHFIIKYELGIELPNSAPVGDKDQSLVPNFHIQDMDIRIPVTFFMNKYNNPKPWASNCAYQVSTHLRSKFYVPRVLSVLDFLLAIFAPQVTIKIRCVRKFNP
jgi:hypothetical protein